MWPSVIYSPALLFIFSSSPAYDDDDKRDSSHAFFSYCLLTVSTPDWKCGAQQSQVIRELFSALLLVVYKK